MGANIVTKNRKITTATTTNLTGVITGNGSVIGSKTNPSGAFVGTTDTQTLTNKTIDGDDNTVQDISSESLKSTVAFSAYLGSSQTLSNGFTKIQCSTEEFDIGSDYDNATNYRFIAPYNGIYHFEGQVALASLADTNRMIATLYKNGSEFKRGVDKTNSGSSDTASIVTATVQLSANDYIELYGYLNSGATKNTILAAQKYNYLSGFLVGKT